MDKKLIRSNMISLRNSYSTDLVYEKSHLIVKLLFMLPEFDEADVVLLYADYRHEVMTKEIFEECIRRKKRVYFPLCEKDSMYFYQVVSIGELKSGSYGIMEPGNRENKYTYNEKVNTLAIIPGVAFDVEGYRLGYGKGFYDRFLDNKPYINKIGLAFCEQLVEKLPREAHDCKMDKVITEKLVYSFLRI